MVRAGVVDHPSKWKWSGYHEIQNPKTRYRLIDHDKLRRLLNTDTNEALAQTHRRWVESQLKTKPERREHFGRSLAVGSSEFIRSIQKALGIRAVGRRVFKTPVAGYQLKEPITAYGNTDSDRTEKDAVMPDTKTIPWKWDALEG